MRVLLSILLALLLAVPAWPQDKPEPPTAEQATEDKEWTVEQPPSKPTGDPVSLKIAFNPGIAHAMKIQMRTKVDLPQMSIDTSLEMNVRLKILRKHENGDVDFATSIELTEARVNDDDMLARMDAALRGSEIWGRVNKQGQVVAGTVRIEGTPEAKQILSGFAGQLGPIVGDWPRRPVRVGESWEVPFDAAGAATAGLKGGELTGKQYQVLERIEKRDGVRCAVIRSIVSFRIEDARIEVRNNRTFKANARGKGGFVSFLGLDGYQRAVEGGFRIAMKLEVAPGNVVDTATTITMQMTGTAEQLSEEEKKALELVRLLRSALEAVRRGDNDSAIRDATAALRIDPDSADAHARRADARFHLGDYEAAIQDYTAALEIREFARGYKMRGDAKRRAGDDGGAIRDYTAALRINPKYAAASSNRASVKFDQRDYDGAIQDCAAALRADPKHAYSYRLRGWVYYRLGIWGEVVADLRRACELGPTYQDYPRLFLWLARARSSQREATQELRAFLQQRPSSKTDVWYLKLARFLVDELPETEMLRATEAGDAKTTRERQCEGYFYAGVKRLVADDLATARDHFRRCLATGCENFIEFAGAEGEMERLRARSRGQTEPTRYRIEVLYTIHKNVRTLEAYQRIQDLFGKTWPELDLRRLEPRIRDLKDYFGIYRDRLLRQEGHSWNEMKATSAPTDDASRAALFERAFSIVKDQATRELKVRGMYQWFRDQAGKDGSKSLRDLFDKLKKHDDPDNPVIATEPGQGLIVYRDFGGKPLTGEDLENIEDSGIKFAHTFRVRVVEIDADLPNLPELSRRAGVLGSAGQGRQIVRLLAIIEDAEKEKERYVRVARKQLATYYESAGVWKTRQKKWPDSLSAMGSINKIRDDPWGNPFVLEKDGETIRVVSWGPDGKQGTDDDIRHGAKEAVPALVAALKAKNAWTRGRAIRALAADVSAAKETVPELAVALKDEDKQVRAWAAYALSQVGPAAKEAVSALSVALKDEDKGVRVHAARALAKIGPAAQEAVPALCAALEDEDQKVRGWAAVALAGIGPAAKEAVPALIAALNDRRTRQSATRALEAIGPAAVPALLTALEDEDRRVRLQVTNILVKIGPAAVPALVSALKDENRFVRFHAAYALGEIGPAAKAAVPALVATLDDEDARVRWRAAATLGALGPAAKEATPALITALKDEDVAVRQNAASALGRLGLATVPALITALKDKGLRGYAATALGEIGPVAREAVPTLEALARDGSEDAKSALQKIRGDLPAGQTPGAWWDGLEDQWKRAFNHVVLGRGETTEQPDELALLRILTSSNLRVVGPRGRGKPKLSFALTNLSGVKHLKRLRVLHCDGNELTGLDEIRDLTELEHLDCHKNKIGSLKGVERLTKLRVVACWATGISSLMELGNLKGIVVISAGHNKITSLRGIENLKNLRQLIVFDNQLTSLKGIEDLGKLQFVRCFDNPLSEAEIRKYKALLPGKIVDSWPPPKR